MKERHIILRSPFAATRDPFAAPSFAASEVHAGNLLVDIEDLSVPDVSRIAHDSDVLAVAPTIPMRLIEPRDVPLRPNLREHP